MRDSRTEINIALAVTGAELERLKAVASGDVGVTTDHENDEVVPGLVGRGLAEVRDGKLVPLDELLGLVETLEQTLFVALVALRERDSVSWFTYYVGEVVTVQVLHLRDAPEMLFSPILTSDLIPHFADALFAGRELEPTDDARVSRADVALALSAAGLAGAKAPAVVEPAPEPDAAATAGLAGCECLWAFSSPYAAVEFACTAAQEVWLLPTDPDAVNPKVDDAQRVSYSLALKLLSVLLPEGIGDETQVLVVPGGE